MENERQVDVSDSGRESQASPAGILVVAALLLTATTENWGSFTWTGLVLLLAALALCVWLHLGRDPFHHISAEPLLLALLIGSIACWCFLTLGQSQGRVQFVLERAGQSVSTWRLTPPGMALKLLAAAALLFALALLVRLRPAVRRASVIALLLLAVAARVLMVFSSPSPDIDVYVSQSMGAKGLLGRCAVVTAVYPQSKAERLGVRAGDVLLSYDRGPGSPEELLAALKSEPRGDQFELTALRRGQLGRLRVTVQESGRSAADDLGIKFERTYLSVYSMIFPSPYSEQPSFDHYGYPPLTVYANAASYALFHDVRALWILADLFGALCIFLLARRSAPGEMGTRIGTLGALVWLFLPRSIFVIEQSWTEPLCVALLGGLVLARSAWAKGAALGLWMASKQYLLAAAPLAVKLRRFGWREWLIAVAAGVATLVPFLFWDWRGMEEDVLGFFLKSEARPDALSLVGALKRFGMELPWPVVAPLWLAGVAFFTWRMKRTTAGWLFSTASLYLFFFAFGKQAFMNYFYLILFILLLAVAATVAEEEQKA